MLLLDSAMNFILSLGAILRTCERNRHLEDSQRRQGLRRRRAESENPSKHYDLLDPLDLDLSFETSKDWSEDDEEVNNQFFFFYYMNLVFYFLLVKVDTIYKKRVYFPES